MDNRAIDEFTYFVRRVKVRPRYTDHRGNVVASDVRVKLKLEDDGETLVIETEDRYE